MGVRLSLRCLFTAPALNRAQSVEKLAVSFYPFVLETTKVSFERGYTLKECP